MTSAQTILSHLLESDDEDEFKEVSRSPSNVVILEPRPHSGELQNDFSVIESYNVVGYNHAGQRQVLGFIWTYHNSDKYPWRKGYWAWEAKNPETGNVMHDNAANKESAAHVLMSRMNWGLVRLLGEAMEDEEVPTDQWAWLRQWDFIPFYKPQQNFQSWERKFPGGIEILVAIKDKVNIHVYGEGHHRPIELLEFPLDPEMVRAKVQGFAKFYGGTVLEAMEDDDLIKDVSGEVVLFPTGSYVTYGGGVWKVMDRTLTTWNTVNHVLRNPLGEWVHGVNERFLETATPEQAAWWEKRDQQVGASAKDRQPRWRGESVDDEELVKEVGAQPIGFLIGIKDKEGYTAYLSKDATHWMPPGSFNNIKDQMLHTRSSAEVTRQDLERTIKLGDDWLHEVFVEPVYEAFQDEEGEIVDVGVREWLITHGFGSKAFTNHWYKEIPGWFIQVDFLLDRQGKPTGYLEARAFERPTMQEVRRVRVAKDMNGLMWALEQIGQWIERDPVNEAMDDEEEGLGKELTPQDIPSLLAHLHFSQPYQRTQFTEWVKEIPGYAVVVRIYPGDPEAYRWNDVMGRTTVSVYNDRNVMQQEFTIWKTDDTDALSQELEIVADTYGHKLIESVNKIVQQLTEGDDDFETKEVGLIGKPPITVRFIRQLQDDEEIAKANFPALKLDDALREQLALELNQNPKLRDTFQVGRLEHEIAEYDVYVHFWRTMPVENLDAEIQRTYDAYGMAGSWIRTIKEASEEDPKELGLPRGDPEAEILNLERCLDELSVHGPGGKQYDLPFRVMIEWLRTPDANTVLGWTWPLIQKQAKEFYLPGLRGAGWDIQANDLQHAIDLVSLYKGTGPGPAQEAMEDPESEMAPSVGHQLVSLGFRNHYNHWVREGEVNHRKSTVWYDEAENKWYLARERRTNSGWVEDFVQGTPSFERLLDWVRESPQGI